jgi:hypothetical protein
MRTRLWIILAAALVMHPFVARADQQGISSAQAGSNPPVAQTLVREGDFAVKLAAELDLGMPSNEAAAEDLLTHAGIAPLNGWLSDYPMTPEIIGQLQDSVSRAASQGRVPMTSDQAVKGLHALAAQFNLPTPAGAGSAEAAAPEAPASASSSEAVNNYYDEIGPPIITYYPPPYDYVYLYDWVPYPVWWFGFWFPGFYMCHDFSTVIVYQSRTVVVSDHFIDHRTGTLVRVDPLGRYRNHYGRPVTALRTDRGDRYRTVADLRRGVRWTGLSDERRFERGGDRRGSHPDGAWSSADRRSAGAIYSRSRRSWPESRWARQEGPSNRREGGHSYSGPATGWSGGRRTGEVRNWSRQKQRYVAPSSPMRRDYGERTRPYGQQGRMLGHGWLSTPYTARGYSGPSAGINRQQGSSGGKQRSSPAQGWQGRDDRGGGFSGVTCRGRC